MRGRVAGPNGGAAAPEIQEKSVKYLTNNCLLSLVQAALADGSTDPNSSSVDMAGYDGCLFVGIVGTITTTGTCTLAVEQSSDDGVADAFSALTGASAVASLAAKSDLLLVIDVQHPTKRYLRTSLTRATANSVWGGTIAIRYRAHDGNSATLAAQLAAAIVRVDGAAEA
jgi:hypothetical protein